MQFVENIQIKGYIPITYCFNYKGHSFPFNFDLFKIYSPYIKRIQTKIEQDKCINIIDENEEDNIELSKEIIKDFIKFVQLEEIGLNDTNVLKLNYLADKYEITALIDYTINYIRKHQKNVIFEMLLTRQNDPKYIEYENIVSNDILYYINDPKLLSLNFPIIYRICNKIITNQKFQNDDVIEFFFKCLDTYGQIASVLFENVDFTNLNTKYLKLINEDYSNIFDFHYINSTFTKSIYKIQNDILLNAEKIKEKLKEQEENNEKMRYENAKLKEQIDRMTLEIGELRQLLDEQKEKQNEKMMQEIDLIKENYDKIIENLTNKIDELTKFKEDQVKKITIKCEKQEEEEKFNGILRYLTKNTEEGNIHDKGIITISSNSISDNDDKYHPKNLVDFDEDNFYESKNEKDAKVCFDFNDMTVQLSGYSILSYANNKNSYGHLKNWTIEVSNDGKNWIEIDEHIKDDSVNGNRIAKYFQVKDRVDSFYRFVQLHMTGNSSYEGIYTVFFYNIEFYGKLRK